MVNDNANLFTYYYNSNNLYSDMFFGIRSNAVFCFSIRSEKDNRINIFYLFIYE